MPRLICTIKDVLKEGFSHCGRSHYDNTFAPEKSSESLDFHCFHGSLLEGANAGIIDFFTYVLAFNSVKTPPHPLRV